MSHPTSDFVFRGILARQAMKELQDRGVLRPPTATPDERREHDFFAPVPEQIRTNSVRMQRQFRLLFVFENLIRDFVSQRFSEADGDAWFETRATTAMKTKVHDRKDKEARNQWHVGRNTHPVFYLDFGDLGLLIINHWQVFKDFFENQAWVQSRITEAERTRNVIAHTNVLAEQEANRLEMYLRDWMLQVL